MGPSGTPRRKCVCFPWAAAEKLICIRRDKCYTHTWTVKNWRVFFLFNLWLVRWSECCGRLPSQDGLCFRGGDRQRKEVLDSSNWSTHVYTCVHTHTRYVCIENIYYYQLEPIKFLHWTTFFGRSLIPHHWLLSLSPVSEIFRLCPLWCHKGHARL